MQFKCKDRDAVYAVNFSKIAIATCRGIVIYILHCWGHPRMTSTKYWGFYPWLLVCSFSAGAYSLTILRSERSGKELHLYEHWADPKPILARCSHKVLRKRRSHFTIWRWKYFRAKKWLFLPPVFTIAFSPTIYIEDTGQPRGLFRMQRPQNLLFTPTQPASDV